MDSTEVSIREQEREMTPKERNTMKSTKIRCYVEDKSKVTFRLVKHPEYFITGVFKYVSFIEDENKEKIEILNNVSNRNEYDPKELTDEEKEELQKALGYGAVPESYGAHFVIAVQTDKGLMYYCIDEIDFETITLADYDPIRYFIREPITSELRDFIFRRDNWECRLKLPGCNNKAEEIDHIIPVSIGGRNIAENLQSSCKNCNLRKSNKLLF